MGEGEGAYHGGSEQSLRLRLVSVLSSRKQACGRMRGAPSFRLATSPSFVDLVSPQAAPQAAQADSEQLYSPPERTRRLPVSLPSFSFPLLVHHLREAPSFFISGGVTQRLAG
jgi:hypothetical protein